MCSIALLKGAGAVTCNGHTSQAHFENSRDQDGLPITCDPVPAAGAGPGRVAPSGHPRPAAQQDSSGLSGLALRFSPRLRK